MNQMQQWASSLCFVVLLASMVSACFPSGAMLRSMKLILGGFVFLGILLPLASCQSQDWSTISWQEEVWDTEAAQEKVNQIFLQQSQQQIAAAVAEELQKQGIVDSEIQIETTTDENNNLAIAKIVVILPATEGEQAATLQDQLEEQFAEQTEVRVRSG